MPIDAHDHQPRKRYRLTLPLMAVLAAALAAGALAACGSSSTSSAANATSSTTTKQAGSGGGRFTALRACLQKQGINLPAPSGGPTQPGSGGTPGPRGGRFQLPQGVTRAKFDEAIKNCGGFPGGARRNGLGKAALTKYAQCMREHGVNLPAPNTSGNGPVFNNKGINMASATFKSAQTACQGELKGAFSAGRPSTGGEGAQPPAGAPPSGGASESL